MFSLDTILLEFVSNNWMSLYILLTSLKGLALITKSTTDDKIITLLSNVYKALRTRKVPDTLEEMEK